MDLNTLLTSGITALVASGIVSLIFKTAIIEKIQSSIKHDYNERLETFKHDLTRNQESISRILDSQNQGYHLGQNERILAIKTYWTNYLMIREFISGISSVDGFITVDETNKLFDEKRGEAIIQMLRTATNIELKPLKDYQNNIEGIRPFINDKIWFQTVFLVTFIGRILYLYKVDILGEDITHWSLDGAIDNLLKDYLTPEEYKYIKKSQIAGIYRVISFVEQKILSEISNIINGKAGANYSMEQAISLGQLHDQGKSKE